jgi:hypothetical protein
VLSAILVAIGLDRRPIVGLVITLVILKITWDSWQTIRHGPKITGSRGKPTSCRSLPTSTSACCECRRGGRVMT